MLAPRRQITRWATLPALGLWLLAAFGAAVQVSRAQELAEQKFAFFQQRLKSLDQAEQVQLSSLGKTLGGRDIWLVTVSQGKPESRPGILIVGSVEATDLAGSQLAVQMVEQLVEALGGEQGDNRTRAEKLLSRVTLYVIPRPNPDASERIFAGLKTASALNERPTDDDRDGELDEDPANDLNEDGVITMLRVKDPLGEWIPHPDDPRVMIKADPQKGEQGQYKLLTEGIDDDQDEQWNEDGPGGVNFNRNFTFKYPFFEAGAGPHQVSEIESRAVADFAFQHPNIAVVYSFAPQDNIHHPWKPNGGSDGSRYKTAIQSADAPFADKLAERCREVLELKDAPAPTGEEGSFVHWAYFHYGRWSLATRAWWVPKVTKEQLAEAQAKGAKEETKEKAPAEKPADPMAKDKAAEKEKKPDDRAADQLNALRWLELEQLNGFVAWQRIPHQDFPLQQVEVGGFRPYVLENPPPKFLAGLAEKHLRALSEIADQLPTLAIPKSSLLQLAPNLFRLTTVVQNTGYLPTMSAQGEASQILPVTQLELSLPEGIKLVSGTARQALPVLKGAGGAVERSWVLLVASGEARQLHIQVTNPAAGSAFTAQQHPVEIPAVKP